MCNTHRPSLSVTQDRSVVMYSQVWSYFFKKIAKQRNSEGIFYHSVTKITVHPHFSNNTSFTKNLEEWHTAGVVINTGPSVQSGQQLHWALQVFDLHQCIHKWKLVWTLLGWSPIPKQECFQATHSLSIIACNVQHYGRCTQCISSKRSKGSPTTIHHFSTTWWFYHFPELLRQWCFLLDGMHSTAPHLERSQRNMNRR